MRLRPGRHRLALALFFALLTCANTFPQIVTLRSRIGYHHDADFGVWRLAWVAHQLPRSPLQLFDANMFYPERKTLAYSDALLLPAVVTAPLQWMRIHPLVVYNLVLLLALWSSAFAAGMLVRDVTGSAVAAALAGTAFAFTSHRFEHYERLELQVCLWMPLAVLALLRLHRSGDARWALWLGLACTAQVYSGIYDGVFLLAYVGIVAVPLAILSAHRRRFATGVAVAFAVTAILCGPYLIPYLDTRHDVGERRRAEVTGYGTRPADFLGSHRNARGLLPLDGFGAPERHLYPGVVVVLLAAVALVPPVPAAVVAAVCGLAFALEMSRGLNGALYGWAFDHVFLFRGLRAPARMAVLVQLSLCILAGFGVARLLAWCRSSIIRTVLAAAIIILGVADHRGRPVLREVTETSRMYSWLARQGDVHVLEIPVAPEVYLSNDPEYLYFSTTHWKPLLNGYSGFFPASYAELQERLKTFPDAASLEYLRARRVDLIVVHRRLLGDAEYTRISTGLLASAAALEARYLEGGQPIDAYRLKR
jgi:hypothetical protein